MADALDASADVQFSFARRLVSFLSQCVSWVLVLHIQVSLSG